MGVKMDEINPKHYTQGKIEVIDFILDQDMNYLQGSALKYLARYRHKYSNVENQVKDLRKAQWFLQKLIESLGHCFACGLKSEDCGCDVHGSD